MQISSPNHMFIIGIKGVAMANLACILHQMGKQVSGSDTEEEFITDVVLHESNISVINSFEASDLPSDTELIVYSAAHGGINNPQVQEALKRGIQTKHQVEVLGELMKDFHTSVAVCGCHGKTTTSAFLSYSLKKMGAKPSYMVGVSEFGIASNSSSSRNEKLYGGEYTGENIFVVEADEYGLNPPHDKTPKFTHLLPTHAICTNIDYDHPDVYDSLEQTKETFLTFFKKVIHLTNHAELQNDIAKASLFFCADDANLMAVAAQLPRECYITFGYSTDADYRITNVQTSEEGTTFDLRVNKITSETNMFHNEMYQFAVSLFGEKNISNAAGAIVCMMRLGFSPEEIAKACKDFTGAKRRFEKLTHINDTYIFDDYAHHPHEIEATINAARARFPTRRILVLFQPHTFTRTESLKHEFVSSLSLADYAFILPIFGSARETVSANAITSVELENLAREKGIQNVFGFETKESALSHLQSILQKGDVIFTMGAGDVYKMEGKIKEFLK